MVGSAVEATVASVEHGDGEATDFSSHCLDDMDVAIDRYQPDAALLRPTGEVGAEAVHYKSLSSRLSDHRAAGLGFGRHCVAGTPLEAL